MGILFDSIPANSIITLTEEQRLPYIERLTRLPKDLQSTLGDAKTGAYIRGLTRSHNLPLETAPRIALTVLQVAIGETPLAKLSATLSSSLRLANDVALKLARELEHDIFSAMALELGRFQKQKTTNVPSISPETDRGVPNVLDLKQTRRPPVPPVPRR